MEPSSGGKKIFRARKTMTPSSRHQIESLNKLRDILEKERVSKETTKESRTVPLTKQDDTNCENDVFAQIFKVESKTPLSEEKDVSPNKLKVSVEVLGIDSSVAACSPEKDTGQFHHQTAQALSPSEVKSYTTEKPPLSKTPIENPLIQNILNDIYDQETRDVFSEHTASDVASKLQDSLSRRLHDMLVQEKRLLATTSPTPLEADNENEDMKVTDQVFPISEKIVIPLNLSEGDDDEGLLPVLERMNAKVDSDLANQPDGAVTLQDLNPSLPDINPVSQSGSGSFPCFVQLPVNDTLDTNVKSKIISIADNEKMTCLDESKTFPQDDTMNINPVSQSGGVGIPCSVQLPTNDTLDTNVKSKIISIADHEKLTCLDESKMFPQDAMDISPVSQSEGVSIPCSAQLPIHNTLDTNVKREIINIPDNEKVTCLDESKTFFQDSMDVDLNNEACGAPESKTDTDLGGKITLPQKDTPAIDLEGKDSPGCATKRLSCPEAEANSKKELVVGNLNNAALCTYFSESISFQGLEVSSQNIDSSRESVIGSFPRKRLNSGNESTTCKRFKSTDDEESSKSEKINGISEKVKILINRQLQIFFSDVFDERLDQLTERVKQIQCGKKHEELAAKCLHKLRRFEKNANIAVKSLKSLLRQHKMQSLTTEPKGTVSHDNILTVQQALLIDKPVPANEVITSTTTKPCLPLHLQTSSAQFATSVAENTTANSAALAYGHGCSALKSSMLVSASGNVPGYVDLQKVSSSVSPASWNSFKAESDTETVVLAERHAASESFNEKVRLKSLTSGNPDGLSRRASTDRGSVLNVKSSNEVSKEEIKKGSGIVIDLTEEESSSKKAVPIKVEESSLKIQNLHCKESEATGTKSLWSLKNVNDHKMNAFLGMQKFFQSIKIPQRSHLEHLNSPEGRRVSLSTKSNPNDETTKELGQKSFGVSENAAKPKFDKSNYGKTEHSNLELKEVQKSRTVPLATHSKNSEKALQNVTHEKRTSVESIVKPLNTVLPDTRRAQYMSHVGSVLDNKATSFPTSLTSQDKETTKKSTQAMEKCFQPSTLIQPELRAGVKDSLPPQKIDLKLTQVQNPRGIALSWNCAEVDLRCCPAHSYCLYVQQEDLKCSRSEWKWKKIGEIKALPLPMACTLSHFVGGSRYYFTLRAKDIYERYGPFSDIQTTLLPLEMSHDSTVARTPGHT